MDIDSNYELLIKKAQKAREFAYAPYSGFKVGAALQLMNDEIILGCNIESITYSPTICAERTAIFKAVSKGNFDFKSITIVTDDDILSSPCGVCRQVLAEFVSEDFLIILANLNGKSETYKFKQFFPLPFKPNNKIGHA